MSTLPANDTPDKGDCYSTERSRVPASFVPPSNIEHLPNKARKLHELVNDGYFYGYGLVCDIVFNPPDDVPNEAAWHLWFQSFNKHRNEIVIRQAAEKLIATGLAVLVEYVLQSTLESIISFDFLTKRSIHCLQHDPQVKGARDEAINRYKVIAKLLFERDISVAAWLAGAKGLSRDAIQMDPRDLFIACVKYKADRSDAKALRKIKQANEFLKFQRATSKGHPDAELDFVVPAIPATLPSVPPPASQSDLKSAAAGKPANETRRGDRADKMVKLHDQMMAALKKTTGGASLKEAVVTTILNITKTPFKNTDIRMQGQIAKKDANSVSHILGALKVAGFLKPKGYEYTLSENN